MSQEKQRQDLPQPKTPMLERMKEVRERAQASGEFMEWLDSQGLAIVSLDALRALEEEVRNRIPVKVLRQLLQICHGSVPDDLEDVDFDDVTIVPVHQDIEKLLSKQMGIDQNQVEKERRALLAHHRLSIGIGDKQDEADLAAIQPKQELREPLKDNTGCDV